MQTDDLVTFFAEVTQLKGKLSLVKALMQRYWRDPTCYFCVPWVVFEWVCFSFFFCFRLAHYCGFSCLVLVVLFWTKLVDRERIHTEDRSSHPVSTLAVYNILSYPPCGQSLTWGHGHCLSQLIFGGYVPCALRELFFADHLYTNCSSFVQSFYFHCTWTYDPTELSYTVLKCWSSGAKLPRSEEMVLFI